MDEAVRAREASRYEVRDITPPALRDVIRELLAETSTVPGALTLISAGASERSVRAVDLDSRAAGVQLIYQGLSLTRSLARDDPWTRRVGSPLDANMRVLAADVMVSRGFSLLARTEAAEKAVETVKTFGRVETERTERPEVDRHANALEHDVFELAITAGVTATGLSPTRSLREYATDLAADLDGVPIADVETVLTDPVVDRLETLLRPQEIAGGTGENAWHSSATDP